MTLFMGGLLGLVVFILLFLALRSLVLWYWKVDKAIALLEKIEENTRSK